EGVRDRGTDKMLRDHGIKVPQRNGGDAKGRPAPVQARILLAYAKTLFSWAVERGAYGLEASPCDHLRSAKIIGEKKSSDRFCQMLNCGLAGGQFRDWTTRMVRFIAFFC